MRNRKDKNHPTFNAQINFVFLSRAKYTIPNAPLPSGRPNSKSSTLNRRSSLNKRDHTVLRKKYIQ